MTEDFLCYFCKILYYCVFSVLQLLLILPLDFSRNKKENRKKLAIKALESVGMEKYIKKTIKKLSSGQQHFHRNYESASKIKSKRNDGSNHHTRYECGRPL